MTDNQVVSSFPLPPSIYELYSDGAVGPPPPVPVHGTYSMFGRAYTTEYALPTLAEAGRQQLFPSGPSMKPRAELKRLNRSLMAKFVELLDVLTRTTDDPLSSGETAAARCVGDMELLLVNVHDVLNSRYRPHQARLTLLDTLDAQLAARRRLVARLHAAMGDSQALVQADAVACLLRHASAASPLPLPGRREAADVRVSSSMPTPAAAAMTVDGQARRTHLLRSAMQRVALASGHSC
eukprot:TRINITY_DN27843_c0_g1_i1.p1 TRINITY_DN27843_c0_g1~~TRINITY_DN27843_c0_g1_i1.p1  ORF type:complete len:238 (+),score=74.65 TRINITY_DN27843_c0_g1_i1:907-1620(+)